MGYYSSYGGGGSYGGGRSGGMNGWAFFLIMIVLCAVGFGAVLYNEAGHTQTELQTTKQELDVAKQGLEQLANENSKLQEEKKALADQLDQATNGAQQQKARADQLQAQNTGLQGKYDGLNKSLSDLQARDLNLQSDYEKLNKSYTETLVQNQTLQKQVAALTIPNTGCAANTAPTQPAGTEVKTVKTLFNQPGSNLAALVMSLGIGGLLLAGTYYGWPFKSWLDGKAQKTSTRKDGRDAGSAEQPTKPAQMRRDGKVEITVTREEVELIRVNRMKNKK